MQFNIQRYSYISKSYAFLGGFSFQILGDEEKRTRYDRGEDVDEMGSGMGGGGFNPFGGGGQQFTFHFEGGFPGGGFPGGFGGFHF